MQTIRSDVLKRATTTYGCLVTQDWLYPNFCVCKLRWPITLCAPTCLAPVTMPGRIDNKIRFTITTLSTVQRLLNQQRRRSVHPGHWPAGMPGRQAVTPVSQSQGFIPVWPLAVIAHSKYHYCAQFTVRAQGEYNCRYKNYSSAVACHQCISTDVLPATGRSQLSGARL